MRQREVKCGIGSRDSAVFQGIDVTIPDVSFLSQELSQSTHLEPRAGSNTLNNLAPLPRHSQGPGKKPTVASSRGGENNQRTKNRPAHHHGRHQEPLFPRRLGEQQEQQQLARAACENAFPQRQGTATETLRSHLRRPRVPSHQKSHGAPTSQRGNQWRGTS